MLQIRWRSDSFNYKWNCIYEFTLFLIIFSFIITDNCFICDSAKPATIEAVQTQMGDFVTLDISGVCFKIMKEKILQYPSSLLFRLLHYSQGSFWHKTNFLPEGIVYLAPNTYFVQRSPELFDIVLQCYSSGKFHAKRAYCKNAVAEELAFWGLNFVQTCDTCFDESQLETKDKHDEFHENFLNSMLHSGGTLGHRAKSSKGALVSCSFVSPVPCTCTHSYIEYFL